MIELVKAEIQDRLETLWNSCEEGLEYSRGNGGWDSASSGSEDGWPAMQEAIEEVAKLVTGVTEFRYTGDIFPKENV